METPHPRNNNKGNNQEIDDTTSSTSSGILTRNPAGRQDNGTRCGQQQGFVGQPAAGIVATAIGNVKIKMGGPYGLGGLIGEQLAGGGQFAGQAVDQGSGIVCGA
jgi:hypothetical protein